MEGWGKDGEEGKKRKRKKGKQKWDGKKNKEEEGKERERVTTPGTVSMGLRV